MSGVGADLDNSTVSTIRVLALMESSCVTGPAKNLIEFAIRAACRRQNRANITVVTFQRGQRVRNTFVEACRKAGVSVHVIREQFRFDVAALSQLQRLIERLDPDIVQTHSVKSHFLMRLSGMHRQRPWIAFHHGYTWTDFKDRSYNSLDRWSLPAAYRVVTVCKPFAAALQRKRVEAAKISVQHNSVNPFTPAADDDVRELRRQLGLSSSAFVLLAVGRLSREKGHIDLVPALEHIRRKRGELPIRLIIVGDGPEMLAINKAAVKHGVRDWIIHVGHQADVSRCFSLADIMVLPSHTEGSPNVLLEAMAAGVPIVATTVGGVPEIATHGETALLVEKKDPCAIAEAILCLLDNPGLRRNLVQSARIVAQSYSPEAYCNSILALYESCLCAYGGSKRGNRNDQRFPEPSQHQAALSPARGVR